MINFSHLVNPWTLSGEPSIITNPEYDWEMHGYAQPTTDPNMWWPKVVEGATAVYGDDGEAYMAYSASGTGRRTTPSDTCASPVVTR